MSSSSLYRHTFYYKCRGSNCDWDNKCDKCMSWTREEMGAYINSFSSSPEISQVQKFFLENL